MFLLFASVALIAADPAQAPAPAAAPATAEPAKEKKVCRKVEFTSSRMARRTCKTESEWAKDASTGANAADLQRMGAR